MPTYDLYLQGVPEEKGGFRTFNLGYNRTIAVCGPYKLALMWLRRFLTLRGSDPLRPDDGTDFPRMIGSNITNISDARDVVLLALQDCNAQITKIQQNATVPLDEQLRTATLLSFKPSGTDGFDVWISITNAKGQDVAVQLPAIAP